jgi:hypothetical protein
MGGCDADFSSGRVVQTSMLFSIRKLQVFDSVVVTIAIDVVNNLVARQFSPQVLLHNQAMLMLPAPLCVWV